MLLDEYHDTAFAIVKNCSAYNGDGTVVLTGDENGLVRQWKHEDGLLTRHLGLLGGTSLGGEVGDIQVSPDGSKVPLYRFEYKHPRCCRPQSALVTSGASCSS